MIFRNDACAFVRRRRINFHRRASCEYKVRARVYCTKKKKYNNINIDKKRFSSSIVREYIYENIIRYGHIGHTYIEHNYMCSYNNICIP